MRVNIYGDELTERVESEVRTPKDTAVPYTGIQFFTGRHYNHSLGDDDSSAIVFWFHNEFERGQLLVAFKKAIDLLEKSATQS